MYPGKAAFSCQCVCKVLLRVSPGLLCWTPLLLSHSMRWTFQFPGISVQFPAIYHVRGINKEENGNAFTVAKTFSFRWRKSYRVNHLRKMTLVLQKIEKLPHVPGSKASLAFPLETNKQQRLNGNVSSSGSLSHKSRHTKDSFLCLTPRYNTL